MIKVDDFVRVRPETLSKRGMADGRYLVVALYEDVGPWCQCVRLAHNGKHFNVELDDVILHDVADAAHPRSRRVPMDVADMIHRREDHMRHKMNSNLAGREWREPLTDGEVEFYAARNGVLGTQSIGKKVPVKGTFDGLFDLIAVPRSFLWDIYPAVPVPPRMTPLETLQSKMVNDLLAHRKLDAFISAEPMEMKPRGPGLTKTLAELQSSLHFHYGDHVKADLKRLDDFVKVFCDMPPPNDQAMAAIAALNGLDVNGRPRSAVEQMKIYTSEIAEWKPPVATYALRDGTAKAFECNCAGVNQFGHEAHEPRCGEVEPECTCLTDVASVAGFSENCPKHGASSVKKPDYDCELCGRYHSDHAGNCFIDHEKCSTELCLIHCDHVPSNPCTGVLAADDDDAQWLCLVGCGLTLTHLCQYEDGCCPGCCGK